jgi:hypothetical protein
MFSQLKEFYTQLASIMGGAALYRNRQHSILHRARVARDQENVKAFRLLMDELVQYWYTYLEQEDRKKDAMNRLISKLLDADTYSPSWEEDPKPGTRSESKSSAPGSSLQSPIELDVDMRKHESNLVQGNVGHHAPRIQRSQALYHEEQWKRQQLLEKRSPVEAQALYAQQRELQQRQRDFEARRSREAHEFRLEETHLQKRQKMLEEKIYEYHQQQQQQRQRQQQLLLRQQQLGCRMQRPSVQTVLPNITQRVQPPLEMGQDQEAFDTNDAQDTVPLLVSQMPMLPSQNQQSYRSMFGSTSNSESTNAGASMSSPSSSSPSSSTASIPWSTNRSADAFTPPTPTQQVQFAGDVMVHSWDDWYETTASNGESSKTQGPHSRATFYEGLSDSDTIFGNMQMSIGTANADASTRRGDAPHTNFGTVQVNENGDEILAMDDIFRGWAGQQEHSVGKGKGKRKAVANDEYKIGHSEDVSGVKRPHQMYVGKGKSRAVDYDHEVVYLD